MPLRAPFDKLADQRDEERHRPVAPSRRRDCHFADALSPSILKHLLTGEAGAAEWQSRRPLVEPQKADRGGCLVRPAGLNPEGLDLLGDELLKRRAI